METTNYEVKISVVMPIYNTPDEWLKKAIDSILNQTYSNFEFIIIDDGSTNNAPSILKEYQEKDNRITVILGEHKGISAALNKGLKASRGEYIARMDGDDIAFPERFEKQVKFLDENKDVSLCGTQIEKFPKKKISKLPEKVKIIDLIKECLIAHPTVMFRRKDFEKYDLKYDENLQTSEDYDLWAKAVRYLKLVNLKEILLYYRDLPTSNGKLKITSTYDYTIREELINFLSSNKKMQHKLYKLVDDDCCTFKPFDYIFSLKNTHRRGKKYKTLTILGFKIRLWEK